LPISARCGRRNVLLTAGETQSGSTRPAVTHKGPDEPALAPTMRRLRQGAWSSISCGVLDPIASLAAPPMPRRANPKSTGRESAWRLTRGQRALCRALRAHKWKLPKLVRKFNCSQRTVSRVLCNTYGDVLSEGARLSSRCERLPRVVTMQFQTAISLLRKTGIGTISGWTLWAAVRPCVIEHSAGNGVFCRRHILRHQPLPPVHPGLPERAPSPTRRKPETSTRLSTPRLLNTSLPWRTSRLFWQKLGSRQLHTSRLHWRCPLSIWRKSIFGGA
jgi:hypothetical protein